MYPRRLRHDFIDTTSLAILIVCALLFHPLASAAPAPVDAEPATVPVPVSEPAPAFPAREPVASIGPVLGSGVDSATLDSQRGGTDTVNNNMQLGGTVTDNVANHVVTGSNSIDAGSFANMSGIPTVIQNSGANVLIQNATIINLQFK